MGDAPMPAIPDALTPGDIVKWFDTPKKLPDKTFELALVLGGTVSAGAYTAGVLDFLIQALDSWKSSTGDSLPTHNVLIRFLTGTSGGGVNAAIFARATAYHFPPVTLATAAADAALNPFYDTWVNQLDLANMLTTTDLDAPGSKVGALLNGAGIDGPASKVIEFTGPQAPARPWLAQPLRVILTVTNLNGIPYRIDFGGPVGAGDTPQQSYVDHADYVRFAFVAPGTTLASAEVRPDEIVMRFDDPAPWPAFQQFACATAAFPIGMPARQLSRPLAHYGYRIVAVPPMVPPDPDKPELGYRALIPNWQAIQDWAAPNGLPATFAFTAVDGGVADNEPIELARTALAGISGRNPRDGTVAKRAVLLIDPFAGNSAMAKPLDHALLGLTGALVTSLTQQTRYDTRDILLAADPSVFSRFMISAQREGKSGDPALATAGLGAFIGFACADFRRHDYMLGRKNCQDFLRDSFVLPVANSLFDGFQDAPTAPLTIKDSSGATFLPIIPLTGACTVPEALPAWPTDAFDPETLRPAIEKRLGLLLTRELGSDFLSGVLAWFASNATKEFLANFAIAKMKAALPQPDPS